MDNVLSEVEDYKIYLGTWTDWSRGPVFGATLTLTRENGTLLIAFIALFVTIVSTSFWRLSCFAFHHFYSSESARDGLHHQRQAILRNSANSTSGIASLFQLLLAWREIAKRPYRRILPLLLLSSLILTGFAACSGFSSKVSSALGSEVLVSGDMCGLFGPLSDTNISEGMTKLSTYMAERYVTAANYALQCYSNKTSSESCQKYTNKRIPFSVQTNASCPFNNDICLTLDQNILLDTGFLSTHEHFGINGPPDEQLLFRKVDHCAPLNLTGRQGHRTDPDSGISYRTYYLGPRILQQTPFTYQYPEMDYLMLHQNETSSAADYTLSILNAYLVNGSYDNPYSYFHPIPELAVPDADLMLFALSENGLEFLEPSQDLWFAASRPSGYKIVQSAMSGTSELYLQDDIVSFLGCTSRQQWCNSTVSEGEQCQPLQGRMSSRDSTFPAQHDKQRRIHNWLSLLIENLMPPMSNLVGTLGVSALTARFRVGSALQGPIPDDQWQLEVQHWFSTCMAALQDAFVAGAAGAPYEELRPFFAPPANPQARNICRNQKVHSAGYMNFSIFGIAVIFGAGGLIIAASYAVEPAVAWLQQRFLRRHLDSYARLEWCTNETMQLQRLANEEIGLGCWDRVDGAVPVARRDDALAVLDLSDPKHPRLRAPPASYEDGARMENGGGGGEGGVGKKAAWEETTETTETTTDDVAGAEMGAARTV
ncbi:hypothetical protein SLS58_005961 [Diplodia intermedia]|uniref:Cytochrome p450 protein n=1 Tax=Diplodia intermedia TaxID=856260 RepID=A0ABR3TPI1_9PEZI